VVQLDAVTGAIKNQVAVGGAPYGSVFDRFGNLWIRDSNSSRMIRVDTNQATLPATFIGPAANCNYMIGADRRGYIYASGSNCIQRMDPSQATPTWEGAAGSATLVLPSACFTRGP